MISAPQAAHVTRARGSLCCLARDRGRSRGHRCLAPGDDLERSWLEAVEYLAEPRHPFLVAGEGTPTPDGRHIRPWAEADERLRVFQVAEEQRGSFSRWLQSTHSLQRLTELVL